MQLECFGQLALPLQLNCVLNRVTEAHDHLLIVADLLHGHPAFRAKLAKSTFERHGAKYAPL